MVACEWAVVAVVMHNQLGSTCCSMEMAAGASQWRLARGLAAAIRVSSLEKPCFNSNALMDLRGSTVT
eukprot:1160450-Pelagomonas_calceolata.AAC.20